MTQQQEAPRRTRLSRDLVLSAAVSLADRTGFDGLTMRTLAQEFGVVPMALYKHVANKEDLLDGMIDIVFSEVAIPTGPDWKTAMRDRSISMREALVRHRWAVGFMESRMRPGPANLRHHNAVMGCLREAGFSFSTTVHAYSTLDSYTYGFLLQEKTLPFDNAEESGKVAAQKLELAPAEAAAQFPYLIEVVMELGMAGYDYDVEFLVGLDLILDGIEKLRPDWVEFTRHAAAMNTGVAVSSTETVWAASSQTVSSRRAERVDGLAGARRPRDADPLPLTVFLHRVVGVQPRHQALALVAVLDEEDEGTRIRFDRVDRAGVRQTGRDQPVSVRFRPPFGDAAVAVVHQRERSEHEIHDVERVGVVADFGREIPARESVDTGGTDERDPLHQLAAGDAVPQRDEVGRGVVHEHPQRRGKPFSHAVELAQRLAIGGVRREPDARVRPYSAAGSRFRGR